MNTLVRDKHSTWTQVTSEVPQGKLLAPFMLIIFINDMALNKKSKSYLNLLSDAAKNLRRVAKEDSWQSLQKDDVSC